VDKHLIIMSVDAMVFEDLQYAATLPNFRELFEKASMVEHMRSIYPSLTHPIHAALITGCYAEKTGITNNEKPIIQQNKPEWYNRLDEIKCDTLIHAVKRAGGTVAACRWPMTSISEFSAGSSQPEVDYLIPEVITLGANESIGEVLSSNGSRVIMQDIAEPNLSILNGQERPEYDEFANKCAADIIKKYKPNLLLTHPGVVDTARHKFGLFGNKVTEAYNYIDRWLGKLIKATKEAGIFEKTDFVILSDHGHLEVKKLSRPNVEFLKEGFITLNADGTVRDWQVMMQSAGLSAQIFVKKEFLIPCVEQMLLSMQKSGEYGIEQVLSAGECREKYNLLGDFSFVIEGDGETEFDNSCESPKLQKYISRNANGNSSGYAHSSHGHIPEKGYQPPFLCVGPSFRTRSYLKHGRIVDVAPTCAEVLGVRLPQAQGEPMCDLLK